jgi:hypothetical protein
LNILNHRRIAGSKSHIAHSFIHSSSIWAID